MIKLIIKISLLSLFLIACQAQNNKTVKKIVDKSKDFKKTIIDNNNYKKQENEYKGILYIVGEPYFINGVEYIPEENYNYNKSGLATFYGKEFHNIKTINNDLNKVTELLGRHKTLPIPSTVKITNLENGLSLIIKINDRHNDNSSIIQVSRKVAQLLKFYKKKIARVRVEILSDPSKQMKIVTNSMKEIEFNTTVKSAPTELVTITELDSNKSDNIKNVFDEKTIEINQEKVEDNDLFLKVYNFSSYDEIKIILEEFNEEFKYTTEKNANKYNLIIGPIENEDANKLVPTFISKGYKNTEILLN